MAQYLVKHGKDLTFTIITHIYVVGTEGVKRMRCCDNFDFLCFLRSQRFCEYFSGICTLKSIEIRDPCSLCSW